MRSYDADDKEVRVGDTVMLARTGKSSGISWRRERVTRLTDKSFWSEQPLRFDSPWLGKKAGEMAEDGPFKLANCIKVAGG